MDRKPNILFITTDMQRYDTLGCYGNHLIRTPNLDELASTGIRFTNAFVNNPVCMPSRATLFTGKLPSAHGVRWNSGGLSAQEITLTKRLHDSGYLTAYIGKLHAGQSFADYEFDHHNIVDGKGRASEGYATYSEVMNERGWDQLPPVTTLDEYKENYGACASPLPIEGHLDGFIADAAIEFLQRRQTDRPFFCWCSFHGPHLPIDPATPWDELYNPKEVPLPVWEEGEFERKPPEQRAFQQNKSRGNGFGDYRSITADPHKLQKFIACYWGKISMIDHLIGKLIEQLRMSGQMDNTAIIFTSDHGDFVGNHRLLFKSALLYDDLLRVPLLIHYPNRWGPGVIESFVEEIDIPAAILRMAGLEPHIGMQGDDLLALLEGRTDVWRDAVYAEAVDKKMIRTEEWKLVHYSGKPYGELYHLREDPNELHNRYEDPDCLAVREEMARRLLDRMCLMEERLHSPVNMLELDDPLMPGNPEHRVKIPYI